MLLTWLRGQINPRSKKRLRRRPASLLLRAEGLEDRSVPSATLVRDINGHTSSSLSYSFAGDGRAAELDGKLYFFADDGVHGRELWSTDGTDAGTQIVKDINPGPIAGSFMYGSGEIARVGNKLLFAANDGVHGSELWVSDGTASGTSMLKDIVESNDVVPEANASYPTMFTAVGDKVFFLASDLTHGQELWVTDGTAGGTHIVADINVGQPMSSIVGQITAVGSQVFFAADDGTGSELWVTDGTSGGTKMVADIAASSSPGSGVAGSSPLSLTAFKGKLYFSADDRVHGQELWVTDGTAAGTAMVKDINTVVYSDPLDVPRTGGSSPNELEVVGDKLYFLAFDGSGAQRLWTTDGTGEGTVEVAPGLDLGQPYLLGTDGTTLYFASTASHDGVYANELWKTDGTAEGTRRLDSLNEPPYGSMPYSTINNIFSHGGDVYFTAGGVLARVSDESVETVGKFEGQPWSNPTRLGAVNGTLYLTADDGSHGAELWKTNGQDDGISLVKDINTTTMPSSPRQLVTIGATTYFVADDGDGVGLWKTDGTDAGTAKVKAFGSGTSWSGDPAALSLMPWPMSAQLDHLTAFDGEIYFTVAGGAGSAHLWKSDGTAEGTIRLTPGEAGIPESPSGPDASILPWYSGGLGNLTVVGSTLYFTSSNWFNHADLWKTDGTPEGTVVVKAFNSPSAELPPIPMGASSSWWPGSIVGDLIDLNGVLYFRADDGVSGAELWTTDGTEAGTLMVKDINPHSAPSSNNPEGPAVPSSSRPGSLTVLNGKLYFAADDGEHGRELWSSDGTSDGTTLVADLAPGVAGGFDEDGADGAASTAMIAANRQLYFNADDGVHGQELWVSDGSGVGTSMLKDIRPAGSAPLYPWGPTVSGSSIQGLTQVGSAVFFAANDGTHGQELWKTDGTAVGTVLVADIAAGAMPSAAGVVAVPLGSAPSRLTNVNGVLYFAATDAEHGSELWTSDGTSAGTQLVDDINPGALSSYEPWYGVGEAAVAVNGANVLFAAWNPAIGAELYAAGIAETKTTTSPGPVSAGGPYRVMEGGVLELTASVTDRPDAARLRYTWDIDGDGQFDDARGKAPTMVGAQLRAMGMFGGPAVRQVAVRVEDAAGNEIGTNTADLLIDDAPLTAVGVNLEVQEGQSFNRNVATFKDVGGFEELTHYSASIDWGDGTSTAGTIVRDGSQLRVAGSHIYARHGSFEVKVSISDDGGSPVVATSTVLVHDAGLYAGRSFIRATAGREFTQQVATFRDLNAASDPADFTAAIEWADGSTSTGTVVALGNGNYQVLGMHTFATAGEYQVKVTITSSGGSTAMATSLARIDPVRITPRGLTAVAKVGIASELAIAAFRDADRGALGEWFTATIDWADGSSSAGSIESDGAGGFKVKGVHLYANVGLYSVKVKVLDNTGVFVMTTGTVRATP